MSSIQLSDVAQQKLQQIHSLVISFQALENDLRDTFQEIESKHQLEKKELQKQINQLKGVETTETSNNALFGAVQLKQNPLSSNTNTSPSPHGNNPTTSFHQSHSMPPQNGYQQNGYQQQQRNQQQQQRNQNGSIFKQQPQMQQSNSYQPRYQQPRSNGYSTSKNVPPPPTMPYGQKPLPKNAGNDDQKSPSSPATDNKKKINLLPDPPKQAAKPKGNMFSNFLNKNKNEKNSELEDLGTGISERDFYKKYWIEAGKIGEGAFARVRKITRKSDKAVFALKMIKKKGKSNEDIQALQREILVLQKCDHENIVRLGDWCDTKKRIYMVVEFCDGGDVFERVVQYKKFSEKSAIHVVEQVASGLSHIHSQKFVHRDLKPDNLMYLTKDVDSKIKIIDFGLAGDCNKGPCKTPCGTAHYAAPEVLSSQEYDMRADLWSLGVIIYTLLCGFPPFFDASNNMKNLYHLIKKGQYSFPSPFWDDISNDAKDLIKKLLVKEPAQRLTSLQVLKHPWITNAQKANDKDLGNKYVQQMSHWQSTRQATEFGLGQEAPPPPPPDQPIPLFYDKANDKK